MSIVQLSARNFTEGEGEFSEDGNIQKEFKGAVFCGR